MNGKLQHAPNAFVCTNVSRYLVPRDFVVPVLICQADNSFVFALVQVGHEVFQRANGPAVFDVHVAVESAR